MKTSWSQPFRWGVLLAFDPEAPGDVPDLFRQNIIRSSGAVLAVPVLHAQDVETPLGWPAEEPIPEATVSVTVCVGEPDDGASAEFDGVLECPSGHLIVGDVENERAIEVPPGTVRVRVRRDPVAFAEAVTLLVDASDV